MIKHSIGLPVPAQPKKILCNSDGLLSERPDFKV